MSFSLYSECNLNKRIIELERNAKFLPLFREVKYRGSHYSVTLSIVVSIVSSQVCSDLSLNRRPLYIEEKTPRGSMRAVD